MKLRARRELPPARIEVIPMIDVMLFLLVFFMLSSLSLVRLNGLPVNLPSAQTGENLSAAPPTLTITSDAQFFLNRRPIDASQLETQLQPFAAGRALIIYADERTSHGAVVRAMDAARAVGLSQLSLSTQSAVAAPAPSPEGAPAAIPGASSEESAEVVPEATAAEPNLEPNAEPNLAPDLEPNLELPAENETAGNSSLESRPETTLPAPEGSSNEENR